MSLPAQFSGYAKPGGGGGTFVRCPATQTFAKLVLPHATLLPAYPDGHGLREAIAQMFPIATPCFHVCSCMCYSIPLGLR